MKKKLKGELLYVSHLIKPSLWKQGKKKKKQCCVFMVDKAVPWGEGGPGFSFGLPLTRQGAWNNSHSILGHSFFRCITYVRLNNI